MIAFLLLSVVPFVRGQSALDGFDPNANGPVRIVVVQPDGKLLLGGEFTSLSPNGGPSVERHYIARLNPDGTLDAAFDPNASGPVYAIALQSDGKILVGGSFGGPNGIGGQPRNLIARLEATTGLADSFDPNGAPGFVVSIAVQANGKILVGGLFNSMGGQTRNNMARLDPSTGLADSFDPNADGLVRSIAVQRDGRILAGGHFNKIAGKARNHIARLDSVTGLADSFDPTANNVVSAIAFQADGRILVGGSFSGANSIGGQKRNYLARLDPVTGLADSFNPNANGTVSTIAVQPDGQILVGGSFNGANSIGGQNRNRMARLDPITGSADSFDPNATDVVEAIAVQSDRKIVAAGYFSGANSVRGQTRNHIARLETDGSLDQTLDLNINGNYVANVAVQPDGRILIGGSFSSVAGVSRRGIARLNQNGTVDMTFDPNVDFGGAPYVGPIVVQSNGKILIGGNFNTVAGVPREGIARLNRDGSLDTTFNPNPNGEGGSGGINTIVSQADGKLIVGGFFQSIGGQSRKYLARLDPNTGLVDSFNPSSNNYVYTAAIQSDGKILVGGAFTKIGGRARNRVARLDPATGLADSFNPDPYGGEIDAITVQQDDKILVGGFLGAIGGQTRWGIARVDAATSLADSFDPRAAPVFSIAEQADGEIVASGNFTVAGEQTRNYIARFDRTSGFPDSFDPNANYVTMFACIQPDGKILAGGLFTDISGQPRSRLARLSNDTAALQNLEVTPNAAVWTLSGASPSCTRVAFEVSGDNVNYIPLGNGTRRGDHWVLAGLNLPRGTNFYVRARGSYRTGTQNASESIMESVRNAFLESNPAPTPCPECPRTR